MSRRFDLDPAAAEHLSVAEQHDWFQQRRSRRSVLRGGAVGAGAVLAGPALLGRGASAESQQQAQSITAAMSKRRRAGHSVAPFGRHLSFGPDASSQMRITWQVPAPIRAPFVRLGLRPHQLGPKVHADLVPLEVPAIAPHPAVTQYYVKAKLDHLLPSTTYYYGVGHHGLDPADPSAPGPVLQFTTAPAGGRRAHPFTFTAFGDQGSSYDAVANDSVILGQDPAFHLHAGDISYAESGGLGRITDSFDGRLWDSWFTQIEVVASQVPWMVAFGNHDMEAWLSPTGYGGQEHRFQFPGNGPAVSPSSYAFSYANVGVISLDANDVSEEIPTNKGFTAGAQEVWLEGQLARFRRSRHIDFVVVFFHHCAYSTCPVHASEGGVRSAWTALFDKHEVDLVINGHNHIYERTDPIRSGSPTRRAPIGSTVSPSRDGTTYITAGAAGRGLYGFGAPDSYGGHTHDVDAIESFVNVAGGRTPETVEWSRVRFSGYSVLAVDVTPAPPGRTTSMCVRALTETGEEFDRVVIARRSDGRGDRRTNP